MGVSIRVTLLSGVYDAAQVEDRERAEWPPHPARLFCALVAAARGEAERAALRWLETQPAPTIRAVDQPRETRMAGFVVTNRMTPSGGSQAHPARTNGLRTRTRAVPANPSVRIDWAGGCSPETVEILDRIARRVPYLGRSTGVALIDAAVASEDDVDKAGGPLENPDADVTFAPCDLLEAEESLRVPYPGYLAALDAQFDGGRPAWEVSRHQGYRRLSTATAPQPAPAADSVFEDVVVFRFVGVRPDGRLAVRFTESLRRACLAVAGDAAPSALHGHDAEGRPHVAFLALPDVGSEHADGHLLGLAVAVPYLGPDERATVLRAALGLRREGVIELGVPGIGKVELSYQPGLVRPWGASPDRWRRGSRRWVTATPMVLDRFPKGPDGVEREVRRGLLAVGLPEPVAITISDHPLIPGAVRLRTGDLPKRTQGRLFRHVDVTFDRVVHGPVLAGAGRYLGVGLLAPMWSGNA